jgi:hypothetical protein
MTDNPNVLYCANHPDTPTTLRCNRCEKPICIKCAVLTPTGYRCRECVRGQQKVYETAQWMDFPLACGLAFIIAFLGSFLAQAMYFLIIFVAPIVGTVIAEVVRVVVRRRRSKRLFQAVTISAVLGSLPLPLLRVGSILLQSSLGTGSLVVLLWYGLYTFLMASTIYYRLAGINIKY